MTVGMIELVVVAGIGIIVVMIAGVAGTGTIAGTTGATTDSMAAKSAAGTIATTSKPISRTPMTTAA